MSTYSGHWHQDHQQNIIKTKQPPAKKYSIKFEVVEEKTFGIIIFIFVFPWANSLSLKLQIEKKI